MRVSIVIPAYNAETTIKKSVESALNQNFPKEEFEVIVVNDGSTDRTLEVLKSFGSRIRVISQENQGAVKAANRGFGEAKGDYVVKLDADDYFEPSLLKEMARVLDEHPEVDFVYSDYYEEQSGSRKLISTKENIFNTIAIGIMFRREKFAEIGFYREGVVFAEYDLLLMTLGKWRGFHIAKPLFRYIRRPESLTGSPERVRAFIQQLKKLHPDKAEQIEKIRGY